MSKIKIKMVCFDFDGTFSNGQFNLTEDGVLSKSYNGKDSYGIKILHDAGIQVGIITAHDSIYYNHLVKFNYFNKLDLFYMGDKDKVQVLDEWRINNKLEWDEIAYMGDDLGDISCLEKVGTPACPNDAVPEVKKECHYLRNGYVCTYKAGAGAVREFIDYLKNANRLYKKAV